MTGCVLDLGGQVEHRLRNAALGLGTRRLDATPPVDLLGVGVLLAGGVAERLGHVADRGAGPVGDHVRDLRGVVTAVALVDVLDHLLAPVALDVDVDVGWPVPFGRQEPFEQQAERHGVGLGDAERVADRRVGGASPPLAVDVGAAAELDEVPHHEEVPGEPELLDDVELAVDRRPRPVAQATFAVHAAGALLGQVAEVLHLGQHAAVELGAGERREVRGDEGQVERRRPADLARQLDDTRVPGETAALLDARSEVGAGARREPGVELVEAAPGPHRGDGGGELSLRRGGVVHVVGGDALDADAVGDLDQRVVARRVDRVAVVPQLDEHPVASEGAHQPLELAPCGRRPVVEQRLRDGALAAPGEHPRHPGHLVGHVGERELRCPLLPRQVPEAQRPGQPRIPRWSVGQHEEVAAVWIGGVGIGQLAGVGLEQGVALGAGDSLFVTQTRGEGDLGPEHGRQPHCPRRLGEADDPVEAVVIGEGERLQPQSSSFGGELLGV